MRICLVNAPENPHIVRWANALASKGHDVKVIPLYKLSLDYMMGGTKPIIVENIFQKIAKHVRWVLDWRANIRSFNPDIIHLHEPIGTIDEAVAFFGMGNLVVSLWGVEVSEESFRKEGLLRRIIKRHTMKSARLLTATSPFLADCAKIWCPSKEIAIIPFGVDLAQFVPKRIKRQGPPVLGFFKGFMERYRPDLFIRALKIISEKINDVEAIMGGWSTPSCRSNCLVLAEELGVMKRIQVLDMLPHNEMPELYERTDATVICSDFESFGVAAIESLAMEIPVVATSVGGLKDLVLEGLTGRIVPPGDHVQLAQAIIQVLQMPDRGKALGVQGRQFVKDKYSWHKNVEQMEGIYRSILS